jgi:hypothetical protein
MGFFNRSKDKSVIPPVAPPPGAGSGGGNAYQDPYAKPAASGGSSDPYARAGGGGGGSDPYARAAGASRGGAAPTKAEAQRNELFAGYTAPVVKPERKYGEEGREQDEDFDEDEEIEGIKQEMRGVKQESLASTRWAKGGTVLTVEMHCDLLERLRRLLVELWPSWVTSLVRLKSETVLMTERIANSERYLDTAKANNQRAEDKAAELKQLNKSIFRPVVTWNKVRH